MQDIQTDNTVQLFNSENKLYIRLNYTLLVFYNLGF